MSISWQRNVKPRPALLVLPPDVDSLDEARSAIKLWEHYSGKTLDSTQRLTVEVMMAESGGRWAARTTGREMPRQNGKGDELECVELWGLIQRGEAILHTAHELTTVSSAHQRMVSLIEGHGDLRRRKLKVLNGLGQQLIEVKGGGVIAYRTRTNGGGRGLDDISRLVVDEAQHAQPEQLASSTPILLANPNPQTNFAGTGAIDGVSDWWWQVRIRALSKSPGALGYVGHTAEDVRLDDDGKVIQEPVDASDQALWWAANPALHSGRGDLAFFEEQLRNLGPALFAREHLGVWDPPPAGLDGDRFLGNWDLLVDPSSMIASHRRIALDVAPKNRFASLGWAGRRVDGMYHVEAFDHRPGTSWVLEACQALKAKWSLPVRVLDPSPAASLIDELREGGVDVESVSSADHAKALGRLDRAVKDKQVWHLGATALTNAVKGAVVRNVGDVEVLARRSSKADISPLLAVTIALGGVPDADVPVDADDLIQ